MDAEQNLVLISIPSVLDPSLAPEGCHSLHAYVPATEPYDLWKDLDRKSPEYEKLKEERSQVLAQHACSYMPCCLLKRLEGSPLNAANIEHEHTSRGVLISSSKWFIFQGATHATARRRASLSEATWCTLNL